MSDLLSLWGDMDKQETENKRENIVKAPFGWPGGKSKSVQEILPSLPYTDTYVEVFGGSGAVLLARHDSKLEVFNDRFSGITDFYRCLRNPKQFDLLCERLNLTLHSREDWSRSKATWENTSDPVERAALWYTMITYSFSALGRNFGRATAPPMRLAGAIRRKLTNFAEVHRRLCNVQIENQSWEMILRDYDSPTTVFYLDPPYVDAYRGTYKHEMTIEDHRHMLDVIFELEGFVALSGYENPLMDSREWDDVHTWEVQVSAKPMAFTETNNKKNLVDNTREKARECLWIKEAVSG